MFNKILRMLGYVWAAPVTFVALVYVALFTFLGWYKYTGVHGNALVWLVQLEKCPPWFVGWWRKWAGHAIGNVVVIKFDPHTGLGNTFLVHEQEHVEQGMRLGVFQPILYGLIYLVMKVSCRNTDAYFDHPMEVDARRTAGQVIDIVGAIKKAVEEGRLQMSGSTVQILKK